MIKIDSLLKETMSKHFSKSLSKELKSIVNHPTKKFITRRSNWGQTLCVCVRTHSTLTQSEISEIVDMSSNVSWRFGEGNFKKQKLPVSRMRLKLVLIGWTSMNPCNWLTRLFWTRSMAMSCEEDQGGSRWRWLPWLPIQEVKSLWTHVVSLTRLECPSS